METTVYVRQSRARVLNIVRDVPNRAKQTTAVAAAAAKAVSKRVRAAFLTKSRGGTDECGHRWTVLARSTALKKLRKKFQTGDSKRPSSALTPNQRDQWWAYYRRSLARHHDKSIAAKMAWERLKRVGGVPVFDKYAVVLNDSILRDTDRLLNSLSVGAPDNVFREMAGCSEYGTQRRGAAAHHRGAGVPRRQLWPPPEDWSHAWWQEVLNAARDEVVKLVIEGLK